MLSVASRRLQSGDAEARGVSVKEGVVRLSGPPWGPVLAPRVLASPLSCRGLG